MCPHGWCQKPSKLNSDFIITKKIQIYNMIVNTISNPRKHLLSLPTRC